MATQVQNRRGTTAEHSTFTGANGELTVDTTKRTLVVHDGATAGGRPLLREDQSNLPTSAPTTGIYNASGSLAISTGGSGRLFVDASGNIGLGTSAPNVRLDVTGTARIGTSGSVDFTLDLGRSGVGTTRSAFLNGNSGNVTFSNQENGFLSFHTNNTERLRITSAGLVGIGTSNPGYPLDIQSEAGGAGLRIRGGSGGLSVLQFTDNAISSQWGAITTASTSCNIEHSSIVRFATASTERVRIDSSGRVGIGTTSPGSELDVRGLGRFYANSSGLSLDNIGRSADNISIIRFLNNAVSTELGRVAHYGNDLDVRNLTANSLTFGTNNTERARIDSSGRLLVGTSSALTAADVSKSKLVVNGDTDGSGYPGRIALNNSVATVLANYKLGEVYFSGQAAGNAAASIACYAESDWNTAGDTTDNPGYLVFSTTPDSGSSPVERLRIGQNGSVILYNTAYLYPNTDNAVTLGGGTNRFTAVYAVTGTIQTSDQRQKTQIVNSALGSDFIKSLRPVSYKWIEGGNRNTTERDEDGNYIYESVPGVRTHWGFIAQEVKQAVDAAGVDFGGWVLTDKDDPDSTQALRYDQFIAPLTKALQEALEKIETLEAKVAALESA